MHKIFKDYKIIVLDIETTGFSREFDRIIEMGVVEYDGENFVREYTTLFGGGKSNISALKVHGIKDCERDGKPSFEDRGNKIASFLSGSKEKPLILIGHNILKFDVPMIQAKLSSVDCKINNFKIIDTYLLSKKFKVASDNYQLQTLCEYFGIEYGHHRGLGDSKSTVDLLRCLIDAVQIEKVDELFAR